MKKCFFSCFLCSKKTCKKGRFFEQNHGLTPFQNDDFLDLFRTSFFRSKKHYFLSRISKNVFFWISLLKKNMRENCWIFFQKKKTCTSPFAKCRFFWTFPELHFSGLKKHFFLFKISKKSFSWLSLFKKTCKKKKSRFIDKNHGLTPLKNVNFFHFLRT